MRLPGLSGTVQIAAAFVLALPVALFGLSLLADGELVLGVGFVAFAAVMVLLPWRLTNPLDPGDVAESAVERVGREEE